MTPPIVRSIRRPPWCEYPRANGDLYYPIPRPETKVQYELYRELADATEGVHFVGRLATYKYYNMDQVVAQAMTLAERLAAASRIEGRAARVAAVAPLPSRDIAAV